MEAATDGKYACAKDFLKRGAEVNEKDYWHNGCTPLHAACERDNPKLVMLLIEYGAEVNSKNKKRKTPLHVASEKDCSKTAKVLM